MNEEPPVRRLEGVADPVARAEVATNRRAPGTRSILVALQLELVIEPWRPLADCARAPVNVAAPKLASGSVWQEYEQSEGASTIHSAELVSTVRALRVLEKPRRRVAS